MTAVGGRALPGWRATLLVVEGHWIWYKRNWRATLFSSVVAPLLLLLAFGLGFGSLLEQGAVQAAGGVSYLVYLAPALLAVGAVQNAAMESTWPILSGFKWQRTYWSVTATPVTIDQLLAGQLCWITLRLVFSGLGYLLVITSFGAVTGAGILAGLVFAVLCGIAFAAPLVAFSASIFNEGGALPAVFRFVVVPMTLLSGTFFPITALPDPVRVLAWASPLWHGTRLARGAALGRLDPLPALGHVAFLVVLLAVGVALARWRFRVRLTP